MKKTINNIFNLIENNLGEECTWSNYQKKLPPIYSENFTFVECVSKTKRFVLIIPKNHLINMDLIKGVISQIDQLSYVLIESKPLANEASNHNIPYFDCYGILHDKNDMIESKNLSYTKTTQLLAKYLLISSDNNRSTRQIASLFGISNTSIKRAYDYLESVGAISRKGVYTSTVSYNIVSRKKLFDCIKSNMINPIKNQLKIFINKATIKKLYDKLLKGAEEVFFDNADIDHSSLIEYVTDSETYEEILLKSYECHSYDGELTYIEEWIYQPDLFTDGHSIDIIDAYIVLKNRYSDNSDSRINNALKEMERKIING